MTIAQRILLRISQVRARLNEVSGLEGEAFTAEIRSEAEGLQNEFADLEVRHQAAIVAEPDPIVTPVTDGGEIQARAALEARCSLAAIVDGVVSSRSIAGAEKELQDALHLDGNQIPLALLRTQARAVTTSPTNVGQSSAPIVQPVFASGIAAFLGVDMPVVPVGEAVFPVLTSSPSARGPFSGSDDADETTGTFSTNMLAPERIQASFSYRRVDRARLAGMDAALRSALASALSEKLDAEVINGTNGLLTGTNLPNNNVTAVTSYASYISSLGYSRVDGRYADSVAQIRIAMGSGTYAHAASVYRATESDRHALDRLIRDTGGVRVSAHVPAVASNRQNAVVRLGSEPAMVAPVWEGVTILPDEITRLKQGEAILSAILLSNTSIIRAAGFYKQQTQHA